MSSENIGLLYSRSVTQPRLKVSVNVNLDGILCIAEPFVTKPNMATHHYKPECQVRKIGFYLQGQGHSNWICVHTRKAWLFLLYVLNCWFFGDQLSLTVHVHKLKSVLWQDCFSVFKLKVTAKVLNFSECFPGQYLWSVKLSMVMHHHQPEYHSEI